MKTQNIKYFFLVLLVSAASFLAPAQSPTKAQKKAEQKKEAQKKRAAKAEAEGKKRHLKLQSKDVQKRMKRNKKRFAHVDSFDRRPNFWQRIFPHKRPSAY